MTTHARSLGSGVQPLIDEIKEAGADPGDLRATVWQATWSRGYDDVVAPLPAARLKEQGFVVYTRPIDGRRYAAIVDTTKALWALVANGPRPSLGSRVKIVPSILDGEMCWEVNIVESLGLCFGVSFSGGPRESQAWIEHSYEALERIGDAEIERRQAIVSERRMVIAAQPVRAFREELDALHDAMVKRVDAETAARPDERAAFDRGNEKQRKAIIDECKRRRIARYNEELAALRARIPELQIEHERRAELAAETRKVVTELEDAASRSRGVTERISIVEMHLREIKESSLSISADCDAIDAFGPADFNELSRSIELLFDLIPRRTIKR